MREGAHIRTTGIHVLMASVFTENCKYPFVTQVTIKYVKKLVSVKKKTSFEVA
jgi:hypothetical protein